MIAAGYVVWPEGAPREAVACRSWLAMQWAMLGPMGWRASLHGRRMSRVWPVYPAGLDTPTIVATQCERAVARFRR